jgi:hypothetical protein
LQFPKSCAQATTLQAPPEQPTTAVFASAHAFPQFPQLNRSAFLSTSQPSLHVPLQLRRLPSAHSHWPAPLQIAYAPHAPQSPPQPSDPHCLPAQVGAQFSHWAPEQPFWQKMSE